jgi:hypothetical protein
MKENESKFAFIYFHLFFQNLDFSNGYSESK